jgi:hypothetical protein
LATPNGDAHVAPRVSVSGDHVCQQDVKDTRSVL